MPFLLSVPWRWGRSDGARSWLAWTRQGVGICHGRAAILAADLELQLLPVFENVIIVVQAHIGIVVGHILAGAVLDINYRRGSAHHRQFVY